MFVCNMIAEDNERSMAKSHPQSVFRLRELSSTEAVSVAGFPRSFRLESGSVFATQVEKFSPAKNGPRKNLILRVTSTATPPTMSPVP